MEPISLILTALVAGVAETAGDLAKDTYKGLKGLIKNRFESQGKSDSVIILDKYEQKPEKTRPLLEDELTEIEADKDDEIIKLAQNLLEQLKSQETTDGEFNVQISGGTVQGLTQQNTGTITQNFN